MTQTQGVHLVCASVSLSVWQGRAQTDLEGWLWRLPEARHGVHLAWPVTNYKQLLSACGQGLVESDSRQVRKNSPFSAAHSLLASIPPPSSLSQACLDHSGLPLLQWWTPRGNCTFLPQFNDIQGGPCFWIPLALGFTSS